MFSFILPIVTCSRRQLSLIIAAILLSVSLAVANPNYTVKNFESWPTSVIEGSTTPQIMINASNDHQLFFKVYNDYSDLDYDGVAETTYKTFIDYFGYFDSTKCYEYDTTVERFEPVGMSDSSHYCQDTMAPYWSGNFLNWAAMARIDVIRKILFGGHRRVDTSTDTVLERSYLPHDAHSWAKYYDGPDIEKLTPFTRGVDYDCDLGDLTGCTLIDPATGMPVLDADGLPIIEYQKMGITLGNTTDVDTDNYGSNEFSQVVTEPPLIKVVKGNYSLWASNERWQITWASGAPFDNHNGNNGNDPALSGIYSYSSSPDWTQGIGEKNYIARIQACVDGLIGSEKCKLYPGPDGTFGTADDNYKPIGLFQFYGDDNQIEFGMVAGSYNKHASGGVIIRNMGPFNDEVNVATDGTFPLVANFAGGPTGNNQAEGAVNAWSLFRIIGYDHGVADNDHGTYNNGDDCTWNLTDPAIVTSDNRCRNWGNPFSEIYYQSINYLSGNGVIGPYRSNSSTGIPGLPAPQPFQDPLDSANYCAELSVINLNSSVISYDHDELDHQSYGPSTVWDPSDLPGNKSTSAMTNIIGANEGIHGNDYYVGLADINSNSGNELCTAKTVNSLGDVGGLCPEAPRLNGSYRIAGLAYYAHTKDIRPDSDNSRKLKGVQKVDTYSIAMSSALPVLDIVHPITGEVSVNLMPACRNISPDPDGNCAIVDYKIVELVTNDGTGTGSGKIYINWEDSEQGGDYDQDMWGILEYILDGNNNTVTIATEVYAESTSFELGFGYAIGGTTHDGFHVHSGANGFTYSEANVTGNGCSSGCNPGDGSSSKTYDLGSSQAELLKDPLWYASKWGGFLDQNDNDLPDLVEEWDRKINATGLTGQDGIPDTYFYATQPRELENALNRVLVAILERNSSGTAAAVVSSNVRGEGALYQAYYEPLKMDNGREANWVGTVQALWLDNFGYTRQDCSPPRGYDAASDSCVSPVGPCLPNGRLDNYCIDQMTETFYDKLEGRTRVRVYDSNDPHAFEPYSMQGVVETYTNGNVTIVPNSMEGTVTFDTTTREMILSPYQVRGTVTAYDPATGATTISVAAGEWDGPNGQTFDSWRIRTSGGPGFGYSSDPITMELNSFNLTINPAGNWVAVGDILTLETQGMVGQAGDAFPNWSVECARGTSAAGEIINFPVTLHNWGGAVFVIENATADFSPCTMARISSFNLKGNPCDVYSSWDVNNLSAGVHGSSTTPLSLVNSLTEPSCSQAGAPLGLIVDPTLAWLKPGDRVMLSNYQFTDKELYSLSYIWNAREQLYLGTVPDPQLSVNRFYDTPASLGRYITTWIDSDLDNEVDNGEYRSFEKTMFPGVSHGFLDVDTQAEAETVVDYVRGIEVPGTRSRTIRYSDTDATENVMRLGDIVNSTPTVVGSPQEAFNLLYSDHSYTLFRKQYQDRRTVVYAGGNDGLLHAFNGGFFNVVDDGFDNQTIEYAVSRKDASGDNLDVAHPLGSEIWAYAPKNTLSHLKWLKDPNYARSHVFYVDGIPRVFDANVFTPDGDHPNGWGTVLVVGMNMGGGEMEIDTAADDHTTGSTVDNIFTRSAYIIFDITNPEVAPRLLGEIQVPDRSYTTVFPAVSAFRDTGTVQNCNGGTLQCNSWHLIFGTGPNNLTTAESSQTAKMYIFDLSQLTTAAARPDVNDPVPAGCAVDVISPGVNIITCDTGVGSTFMGTPVVVDWDLDFYADTSYFGLVGDQSAAFGRLMRMSFNNEVDPGSWSPMNTFFQTNQPVSIQPLPAIDTLANKWVYFGTGRYKALGDKTSTATQSLYGIKDDGSGTTVAAFELLDVTNTEIYTDRSITDPPLPVSGDPITNFDELEAEIDDLASGWYLDLPPIIGAAGLVPSTRSITDQALLGGVLFTSVFQPSEDPCTGEGLSRLYGLYYKTGTAYPGPTVFGSSPEERNGNVMLRSLKYLDLGIGVATAPAIHSGSGSGDEGLSVFTQLSTGDIIREQVEAITPVRTGKLSWREQ